MTNLQPDFERFESVQYKTLEIFEITMGILLNEYSLFFIHFFSSFFSYPKMPISADAVLRGQWPRIPHWFARGVRWWNTERYVKVLSFLLFSRNNVSRFMDNTTGNRDLALYSPFIFDMLSSMRIEFVSASLYSTNTAVVSGTILI